MSNFRKRQLARENMDADIRLENDGQTIIAPYAETDSDLAALEKQVDGEIQIVEEGEVLAEDTETLEQVEDKLEDEDAEVSEDEAETIQIATESIARRWGVQPSRKLSRENFGRDRKDNRVLAREGVSDTLKGMWEAFIEWIKTLWDKARETWKKYVNAGKSLRSQSETNAKIIDTLGSKKKDTIKGAFIKQLSIGKEFAGNNVAALEKIGAECTDVAAVEKATEAAIKMIETAQGDASKVKTVAQEMTKSASESVENGVKKLIVKDGILGGEEARVTLTEKEGAVSVAFDIKAVDKSDLKSEVDTPEIGVLSELNDMMGDFGKDLETYINKFRKVESSRAKALKDLEKIKNDAGKGAETSEDKAAARDIKRGVTIIITSIGQMESVQNKCRVNLAKGLSGYIRTAIGAYGKE